MPFKGPDPVINITTFKNSASYAFTLNWMKPNASNGIITHYTVFYLPLSDPYGPIMTDNKMRLDEGGAEFAINFTTTTGTLTNLNGSVTYRIQVAAVAVHDEQKLMGNRSNAVMVTTSEGGNYSTKIILLQILSHYRDL